MDEVPLLLKAPTEVADHHIIPAFRGNDKYSDFIKSRGINVDDYCITIAHGGKNSHHLKFIEGRGYNKQWRQWIDDNPLATDKDIFQFAGTMMDRYKLTSYKIHKYNESKIY